MTNLYHELKQRLPNLKRAGLSLLLAGSMMPVIMGQSGCQTINPGDIGAASYGALANIKASQGNYKQAAGYGAAAQLFAIAGQREYQNNQSELERNAQIEAANIQAQSQRDAANIGAKSVFISAPNAPTPDYRAFACNEEIKDDNNMITGYKGKGKTEFDKNERIEFKLEAFNRKDSVVTYKLFKDDNNVPFSIENNVLPNNAYVIGCRLINPNAGNYKCEWSSDGSPQPIRVTKIKVIDSSKTEDKFPNSSSVPISPSQPAQLSSSDITENLQKLRKLTDAGIFTEEEYKAKRKEILENAYK